MAGFNKTFNIVTFNCKHFKSRGPKFDFVQSLMKNNDILLLQEHCLFKGCIDKLKNLDTNVDVIGKSSMDESITLEGRPHGGVAIVYKSNLKCQIDEVECNNIRLCGVTVSLNEGSLLILNTYMPCDSGRRDESFDDYIDVLNEVCQIIHREKPLL
jgi:exonuclease III